VQSRLRNAFIIICGALVLMFSAGSLVPAEAGYYVTHRTVSKQKVPRYSAKSVQRSLREAGYPIAVDGVIGPQTRSALRDFQSAHGLEPTGRVNKATLTKLGL
jgi:lysozyme family protein